MLVRAGMAIVVALMIAAPSWAADGPFGIAMGTKAESLNAKSSRVGSDGLTSYTIKAPSPSADFVAFIAYLKPETGVCKLLAAGHSLKNDLNGHLVRNRFDAVKAQLTAKYGPPSAEVDELKPGASLTKEMEFSAAIDERQRELSAMWILSSPSSDHVEALRLSAEASFSGTDTYVQVTYLFSNYDQCVPTKQTAVDAGL